MARSLKNFAENVYVNLVSGLVLLVSSSIEIVHTIGKGEIGAHHGVAVFALVQVLRVLPDLVHGAEGVTKVQQQ